jgi:O-antigen/teichoic acid export membrane protein
MISNAAGKIVQLLLLPIITGILLTEEYGYYDLIISTISLVLPLISFQIIEALFKFIFKAKKNEKIEIISTVVVFLGGSIFLLAVLLYILSEFTNVIQYPVLIFFHYASFTIYTLYQKISRSTQKNVAFAISGVVHTFVLIGIQILLLIVFKMRLEALFIANIVANLISIIYLEFIVCARKMISLKRVKKNILGMLLRFSLPLVPNSISWWATSSINTYFVTFFLGVGFNGIYSVAYKFPQLVTFVTSVFQLAWQESAIMESDSKTRTHFYSSVFNAYARFLLTAMIVILPFTKIAMPYLVAESYLNGMILVPILLAGSIFASLSQFYGVGYLAFNETKGAISTTIVAAVINCLIVISLISSIGLFAPALGTMFAYLIQWFYRIYQMRNYFKLKIEWDKFALYGSIAIGYILIFYLIDNDYIQGIFLGIAAIIFLLVNLVLIKSIVKKVLTKLGKSNR